MSDLEPTPQTCLDVARAMVAQPALFSDLDGMDGFSPTAQAVQRYTGERSTSDDQRNLFVGAMRLLGASDRQIEEACKARGFGLTRRTIPLILADLEKSGRITPLKERLALACGDNAERANTILRMLFDKIEAGLSQSPVDVGEDTPVIVQPGVTTEMAAMVKALATAVGITTEKVLLLTGQATEIVETRVAAGREEFESWWRDQVKPIAATVTSSKPAVDFVSPSPAALSEPSGTDQPTRHDPDTSAAADPLPTDHDQAPPIATPPPARPPEEQAGGGSPPTGDR